MNLSIEIHGANEISKEFKERAKKIPDAIERIISKVALTVERHGKYYSPVDTGLMRSTIYPVRMNGDEVWVGPKVNYAKYVHRRVPFMTAAREDTLPSVQGIIKQEIRKAIK